MNKNVVVFSFAVAAVILFILLFSILAILYFYWGNIEAVKDSLATVSSLFGGITTIGAAVVAAYLFNDWKIQHNKTMEVQLSLRMVEKFEIFDEYLTSVYGPIKTAYDLKNHELLEVAIDNFKKNRNEKLLQIFLNFATVCIAIEHCSLLNDDYEAVKNKLRESQSAFRKYTNSCMNLDISLNYNSYATKFLYASKSILPHINEIEEKYILKALKNLKA